MILTLLVALVAARGANRSATYDHTRCLTDKPASSSRALAWFIFLSPDVPRMDQIAREFARSVESARYNTIGASFILAMPLTADKNSTLLAPILDTCRKYSVSIVTVPALGDLKLDSSVVQAINKNNNCCKGQEYLKLYAWMFSDYDRVMMVDTDIIFLQNVDFLFSCPVPFLYTRGLMSPLNGGMIVLTPSDKDFEAMTTILATPGVYDSKGFWNRTGYHLKKFLFHRKIHPHGIEGPQGFFYYYFVQRSARGAQLDMCRFNFQGCATTALKDVYIMHKMIPGDKRAPILRNLTAKMSRVVSKAKPLRSRKEGIAD